MMGRNHAALGAVICLGIGRTMGLSTQLLLASTICVSGAALLPDIDEQGSTVAHLFEPISGFVAHITNKMMGGHRMGTHSLVGVCLIGTALWISTLFKFGHIEVIAPCSLVSICATLMIRASVPALFRPSKVVSLALGVGVSYAIYRYVGLGFVPLAVTLGWGTHLLGDMLTRGGVPFLWPFSKDHFEMAILKRTNSIRERVFGICLALMSILLGWREIILLLSMIGARLRISNYF